MYGYIYKTTNLKNKMIYIGQHKSDKFEPEKYKGSGKKLREEFQRFGKKNFVCELIQWCATAEELNAAEKYWISYFNTKNPEIGYNRADGGVGNFYFTNCSHTIEERSKIGKSSRNRVHIYKEKLQKFIKKQELARYLEAGWAIGHLVDKSFNTAAYRQKISDAKKGKHYYTNGIKIVFISDEEVFDYEHLGYFPGQSLHEYYWMNNNGHDYEIPKESFIYYRDLGYQLGRVTKGLTPEHKIAFIAKQKSIKRPRKKETIEKFSEARKGHLVSEVTRSKISESLKKYNLEKKKRLLTDDK